MATSIYKILKKLSTKINKVAEIASEIDPISNEEIDRAFNNSMSGKWIGLLNSEEYIELAKMVAEEYDQITYLKGEWVWYNNNLYEALIDISTAEAFNAEHWLLLYEGDTPIEITDLTDTVWYMNDTPEFTGISYKVYDLDGIAGPYNFSDYGWEFLSSNGTTNIYVLDDDPALYDSDGTGWLGTSYRVIRITGGNDATDTDLINWFKRNGQFIEEGNLLTTPYYKQEQSGNPYTLNGITFTVNNDNSITINGTTSGNSSSYLFTQNETLSYDGSKYVLAGATTSSKCYMRFEVADYDYGDYFYYNDKGDGVIINHGELYPTSSDMTYTVYIHVDANTTVDNMTFNPILIKID